FGDSNDVAMFGRTDPDSGEIINAPTIPVEIDMGSGNDVVGYSGSGSATLYGGTGDDNIEWLGFGSGTINGGAGDVYLIHSGGTGIVTIHGNDGSDRLIGGNVLDILRGGNGNDELTGPAKTMTGGAGDDILNVGIAVQNGAISVDA